VGDNLVVTVMMDITLNYAIERLIVMTKSKQRTKEESSPGANREQLDKVHKMADSIPQSMIQPNASPNMSGTASTGSYIPSHLQFLIPQGQPLYQYMILQPGH
jgi:hypothetical protein